MNIHLRRWRRGAVGLRGVGGRDNSITILFKGWLVATEGRVSELRDRWAIVGDGTRMLSKPGSWQEHVIYTALALTEGVLRTR